MSKEEVARLLLQHAQKIRGMAVYYYKVRLSSHRSAAAWSADDIFQEAQLKALTMAHKYQDDNFLGWIHYIVRNAATDIINKARKMPVDSGIHEGYERRVSNVHKDTAPLPDEELQRKQRALALHAAVSKLSDTQQLVMLYTVEERYDNTGNLSREIGVPELSIRQFRHQAFKHLRKDKDLKHHNPNNA